MAKLFSVVVFCMFVYCLMDSIPEMEKIGGYTMKVISFLVFDDTISIPFFRTGSFSLEFNADFLTAIYQSTCF